MSILHCMREGTGRVKGMSLSKNAFGGRAEELSFMRDPDLYNPPASLRSASHLLAR